MPEKLSLGIIKTILWDGVFRFLISELCIWIIRADMTTTDNETKITLTATERRVLQLIAEGKTGPQIASVLCLSLPTIKWYRKKLRAKFGVATTMQMVRRAIELKMI